VQLASTFKTTSLTREDSPVTLSSVRRLLPLFFSGVFFHSVARLAFYCWNMKNFASAPVGQVLEAFLWGLRFDFSATAALLAPAFLFVWILRPWVPEKVTKAFVFGSYTVLLFPAIFLNFVDVEMINIVGRRFSFQTLFILGESEGKVGAVFSEYAFISTICLLVCAAAIYFNWFVVYRWKPKSQFPQKLLHHYAIGFLALVFMVISIRGGLQEKPLNFTHSQLFTSSWLNHLVLNSSFSIIKSAGQESVQRQAFFKSPDEKYKYLNSAVVGEDSLKNVRPKTPQNVVVIILESFGLEYVDEKYTPFFVELSKKGLYFKNGVANARRSIEGVPAVLTGVPTLMDEPFITSPFATNNILKLPQVLKEKGYQTAFFHGGNNGTMYLDSFAKSIGFEKYFGANEYPNKKDHDGFWGIYDGPFFQFFESQMNQMKPPFMAAIFSLSSHHPYKIPDEVKGQFPEGPIPILKAIAYADDSVRKFFEKAEKEPWYKDTLFILTPDHTQLNYKPEFANDVSKYKIPVLFFHPSLKLPMTDPEMIVQQIDIPASILDFLGIDTAKPLPNTSSAFRAGDKAATVRLDTKYMLIAKDYFLDWSLGKDILMFDMKDAAESKPLSEPADRKELLENKLKANIEYFNNGMLDNKLL
jgi:phosphoglycerol transferase MdoB-like AlkP superfamily enzyme